MNQIKKSFGPILDTNKIKLLYKFEIDRIKENLVSHLANSLFSWSRRLTSLDRSSFQRARNDISLIPIVYFLQGPASVHD